jgi:hypothetical protein
MVPGADAKQVFDRFGSASEPAFWKTLNPDLHVCVDEVARPPADLESPERLVAQLRREGWCRQDLGESVSAHRLREAIERIRAAGFHPTFALIYDEFWDLAAHPALTHVLAASLGEGFRMRLDFWVNYVDRGAQSRGWRPHQDCYTDVLEPDGMPNMINVWIPLTDATLDNGCMYLVPADRAPEGTAGYALMDTMRKPFVDELLHAARALPAPAGSALLWGGQVIHWGSYSTSAALEPRVSVALAYQSVRPNAPEHVTVDLADGRPAFKSRLKAIASQFLTLQAMYSTDLLAAESLQVSMLIDRFVKV